MNTFTLACPADSVLLDEAIARFKTPGIRDLDHSAPYIHNGKFDTLDNAVGFYLGLIEQCTGWVRFVTTPTR